VLHIGCADSPLTEYRITNGDILHKKLLEVTGALIGIDIDDEGLKKLEANFGGDYLCYDISVGGPLPESLRHFYPDVILAADVIEHVPAPGPFLRGLVSLADTNGQEARIVISTPNGLNARSAVHTAFGVELVHPDHRLILTPRTLRTLATDVNLVCTGWYFYNVKSGSALPLRLTDYFFRCITKVRSAYADGMVAVFRLV
jgi:hypothetical protein